MSQLEVVYFSYPWRLSFFALDAQHSALEYTGQEINDRQVVFGQSYLACERKFVSRNNGQE